MLQNLIGSILVGGLLLFCVLALIIPIFVELGKMQRVKVSGNFGRILLTIGGVGSVFVLFWLLT